MASKQAGCFWSTVHGSRDYNRDGLNTSTHHSWRKRKSAFYTSSKSGCSHDEQPLDSFLALSSSRLCSCALPSNLYAAFVHLQKIKNKNVALLGWFVANERTKRNAYPPPPKERPPIERATVTLIAGTSMYEHSRGTLATDATVSPPAFCLLMARYTVRRACIRGQALHGLNAFASISLHPFEKASTQD